MVTITAAAVGASDSLEKFRQEFNTLRSDVGAPTAGTSNFTSGSNAGLSLQSGSLRNVLVGDEKLEDSTFSF